MKSSITRRTVFDSLSFAFLFCVAMIVIFSPTQDDLLNLKMNLIVFLGGAALGTAISFGMNSMNMKTLGEVIFEPDYKKAQAEEIEWYKTVWGWQMLVLLTVTFVVGLNKTRFSLTELLDEEGFKGAIRLFQGLANPNFDILPKAVLNIIETIFMAFIATSLAIPIAFVLSFMAARNIMVHPFAVIIYSVLRMTMNIMRSIEALIWAIIFSVWVGIGPFAGMLALLIHSVASLTKQYSEMIETVDDGPIEGILSTGATKLQMIWYAIVPQVVLPFISFTVYRWDINVRMATIIGLVGGGGIGTMLIQYQGQAMWPEVGTIIFVIAFVVWAMDQASSYLREALK